MRKRGSTWSSVLLASGALIAACNERPTPTSPRIGRAGYDSVATCADGGPCHVDYNGGNVIPNAKIYLVLWTAAVVPNGNLGDYYQAVTNSAYLDWLNEYNTNITIPHGLDAGWPGTNQIVGRGVTAATITITPSAANAGGTATCAGASSTNCCPSVLNPHAGATCVGDQQIQSELNAQIVAGTLPPPDADTLYVTYFPPGVFIYDSTPSGSCTGGGFCGYHGTFKSADREFYYGVLPDHGPGSGCDFGCGPSNSACDSTHLDQCFKNLGSTSGHELAEAITDPEIGIVGNGPDAPPLGWYDDRNFEVGDMCGSPPGAPGTGTGLIGGFTVQDIWSNLAGKCIVVRDTTNTPSVTADFAVAFNAAGKPNQISVVAGDTAGVVVPILLPTTGGSPQALALSVPPLPPGVHAALSTNTANSGDTSVTLTVTADAGSANLRDLVIAVRAQSGTGATANIHSAGLLVQVTGGGTGYDFSLAMTPPSRTIAPGTSGSFTVGTALLYGLVSESIALSVPSTLPPGVTASFSPTSVSPGGSAALTVTASSSAAGAFNFTVVAAAPSRTHSIAASAAVGTNSFTLSISPGSLSVARGAAVTCAVTSAVAAGFPETIALTASGLPSGVTAGFNPRSISAGSSSTLTLTATASAAAPSATQLAVTGTAPSSTVIANAQLSVVTGNDFALSLSPAAVTVRRGGSAQLTVATALAGGAAETVSLSVSGLPAGVAATFTPPSLSAGQLSLLTLAASATAPLASSLALTITGSSASATHAAAATLAVATAPAPPAGGGTPKGGGCASGGASLSALLGLLITLRRRRVTEPLPREMVRGWRSPSSSPATWTSSIPR